MTTATLPNLSRTILAASLALVGTIASFGITTSPAQAQASSKSNSAALAAAIAAPRKEVINGVVWNCVGDSCVGPVDGSRAASTCARVAKKFGPLASFTTPKGALTAEELQRCNAAA